MKKTLLHLSEDTLQALTEQEQQLLQEFFADFRIHCLLNKKEKKRLWEDFERAILYYLDGGLSLGEALQRLDVKQLGGFYARPPVLWFPLDDAAKIYPLSMGHDKMTMFRLSVTLKKAVVPELLQMALNFTIKRFPSFATTLKKGVFWHYLDTNKRRFSVHRESGIPCQPLKVSASGSQSFRVVYWENRISVEFFHVLTDGAGGMTFLKVLTAEYLRLTGVSAVPGETLWDCNATPASEEFENTFTRVPRSDSASGFVDKIAVQMNGKLSANKPCRVLHFKMSAAQLKAAAARCGTTVTVYLLAQLFLAIRAATDELQGEISIQVPVNMRKFYPSRTVRNFSMYCGIRLPVKEIEEAKSLIAPILNQLEQKASKESMSRMLTATVRLVGMLRCIPLVIKQPVAKLVYGFLGDKIFTMTFSNLGVVQLPEALAGEIDGMDFLLGAGSTNRVSCSMVTINDSACLSMTKMTVDPSFEEKLYSLLQADGIAVEAEGSELYED